jgi:hypothetical protein
MQRILGEKSMTSLSRIVSDQSIAGPMPDRLAERRAAAPRDRVAIALLRVGAVGLTNAIVESAPAGDVRRHGGQRRRFAPYAWAVTP